MMIDSLDEVRGIKVGHDMRRRSSGGNACRHSMSPGSKWEGDLEQGGEGEIISRGCGAVLAKRV